MAPALLTIGKCVFAVLAVCVGGRLFAEVRQERKRGGSGLGLHALALAAIVSGGAGLLLLPAGDALGNPVVVVVGEVAIRIAMLILCLFLLRTFRPGQAVGWLAAAICSVFLLGSIGWDLVAQPSLVAYDYTRPSSHANQLSIALVFLWAAVESWMAFTAGRRRLALGLIAPAVVRSYGLWCMATLAFSGIGLLAIFAGFAEAAGATGAAHAAHGTRGVLYLVVAGSVWLGLFRRSPAGAAPSVERAE